MLGGLKRDEGRGEGLCGGEEGTEEKGSRWRRKARRKGEVRAKEEGWGSRELRRRAEAGMAVEEV